MDVTPLLFGKHSWGWDERSKVSVVFGANMLLLAWWIDRQTVQVRNTRVYLRDWADTAAGLQLLVVLVWWLSIHWRHVGAHTLEGKCAAFVTLSGFIDVVTCSFSTKITKGFVVHLVARPLSMREVRGSKPCESNFFFFLIFLLVCLSVRALPLTTLSNTFFLFWVPRLSRKLDAL